MLPLELDLFIEYLNDEPAIFYGDPQGNLPQCPNSRPGDNLILAGILFELVKDIRHITFGCQVLQNIDFGDLEVGWFVDLTEKVLVEFLKIVFATD